MMSGGDGDDVLSDPEDYGQQPVHKGVTPQYTKENARRKRHETKTKEVDVMKLFDRSFTQCLGTRVTPLDRERANRRRFRIPDLIPVFDRKPPSKTVVCVTGASGFLGSHVVEQCLKSGYLVRGTVRESTHQAGGHRHLLEFSGTNNLQLFWANLNDEGSYDEPFRGADFVIHCASPYSFTVKDPLKELLNPAVDGTLNVLKSAKRAGVMRVVMTSALAAVLDTPDEAHTYSEADWNGGSTLTHNPYSLSKTESEKAAWAFAANNNLDLVVLNPGFVIGPAHTSRLNESNRLMQSFLSDKFPIILPLWFPFVDVRDLALFHIVALEDQSCRGRYIVSNTPMTMERLVQQLSTRHPRYNYPALNWNNQAGVAVASAGTYFLPGQLGDMLRSNIGNTLLLDTRKSQIFGPLRDFSSTLNDTVLDLVKWGHVADMQTSRLGSGALLDLQKLMEDPQEGVGIRDRQWFATVYESCWVGSEAVDWMHAHLQFPHRSSAVRVLEQMYTRRMCRNVVEDHIGMFEDSSQEWYVFNVAVLPVVKPPPPTATISDLKDVDENKPVTISQKVASMAGNASQEGYVVVNNAAGGGFKGQVAQYVVAQSVAKAGLEAQIAIDEKRSALEAAQRRASEQIDAARLSFA